MLRIRFCLHPLWSALAALAPLSAGAAAEPTIVALPPFMVEEAAKGPPWRYAQSPDFEVLSRCNDTTTRSLTETYFRLHRLLALVLPENLQVKHAVQKTIIFYDEEMRPAASQEVIAQMLRGANAAPPPPADTDFARGLRSMPVQRRYTFMPNMRLWDRDAMGVFAIVRNGTIDADNMFLTPDYVGYLLKNRTPTLPTWFIAGLVSLYPQLKFAGDTLTLEPAEWVSPAETRLLKADPKTARPVLPMAAFFRGDASANGQTNAENMRLWSSQAELVIRWALDGRGSPRREGFWKFVERSAVHFPTEALVQECFGLDHAALGQQLAAYLPEAVRKDVKLRLAASVRMPALGLRNATDAEIGRIKGDWERLQIAFVRARYPELAGKYIEQARRTLLRAYDRNERDPRLLAILGLCEIDAGNDAGARDYLEAAARLDVVRPRAWFELARLRFAERRAELGSDGKLSATQVAEVLTPLFAARRQLPPLPEVYDLIADVWAQSAVTPNTGHLAVLAEGVGLFPRRLRLVERTGALYLAHGYTTDATAYINLGLRLANDEAERARFVELQARVPAGAGGR